MSLRESIKQKGEVSYGVYNGRYRSRKAGLFGLRHEREGARHAAARTETGLPGGLAATAAGGHGGGDGSLQQCSSLGSFLHAKRPGSALDGGPVREAVCKSRAIKNDRQDAEAIATAARQGNMRFVTVKTVAQQVRLSWHRVRDGYKKDALAVTNRIRGLLAEFGVVISRSNLALRRALAELDALELPPELKELIRLQQQHWSQIEAQRKLCDERIQAHAEQDERCRRIRGLTGVGPLTADAIVASIGNAQDFKNGRQCAAWLGLTPSQHGTGGRVLLGRISCRGDGYLRSLLIQGARSSLQRAKITPEERQTPEQKWIVQLAIRLPFGKVLAAIANEHARQIWAMLARGEAYDPEAWLKHPMVQRG